MNQSQAFERKMIKSKPLTLDEIFQGKKFKNYFKKEIDIELKYIQNAHEYLISDNNKALESIREVFLFWKNLTPHFDSFPCRFQDGSCIYCYKPSELTDAEIDYILLKMEV